VASGQAKLPLYLQALPSLSLAPEFHLLSDQWQQYILIGVGTLLRTVHEKDLGCRLLMRIIPKPSPNSPWSMENLSFTKPVPGAKKDGGC